VKKLKEKENKDKEKWKVSTSPPTTLEAGDQ